MLTRAFFQCLLNADRLGALITCFGNLFKVADRPLSKEMTPNHRNIEWFVLKGTLEIIPTEYNSLITEADDPDS